MRVANAADSPAPAKASASRRENLAFFMVLPLSALVSLTRQRVIRFPALALRACTMGLVDCSYLAKLSASAPVFDYCNRTIL